MDTEVALRNETELSLRMLELIPMQNAILNFFHQSNRISIFSYKYSFAVEIILKF